MRRNYYKKGDYNVICDATGFKVKRSQCRYQKWNNLLVLKDHWEPRHPQDFVRSIPDGKPVPLARPEPEDVFI